MSKRVLLLLRIRGQWSDLQHRSEVTRRGGERVPAALHGGYAPPRPPDHPGAPEPGGEYLYGDRARGRNCSPFRSPAALVSPGTKSDAQVFQLGGGAGEARGGLAHLVPHTGDDDGDVGGGDDDYDDDDDDCQEEVAN